MGVETETPVHTQVPGLHFAIYTEPATGPALGHRIPGRDNQRLFLIHRKAILKSRSRPTLHPISPNAGYTLHCKGSWGMSSRSQGVMCPPSIWRFHFLKRTNIEEHEAESRAPGSGSQKGSQEEREADSEASLGRKDQNETLGARAWGAHVALSTGGGVPWALGVGQSWLCRSPLWLWANDSSSWKLSFFFCKMGTAKARPSWGYFASKRLTAHPAALGTQEALSD